MPVQSQFPVIDLLKTSGGAVIAFIVSLVLVAAVILWARRPGHPNRRAALFAAVAATVLLGIIYMVAVALGWWGGPFFELPLLSQITINVTLAVVGWVIWMMLYLLLEKVTRRAFWIYMLGMLIFIPVTLIVDRFNINRGMLALGGGYTVLVDAILGVIVMWSPVVFYTLIRRQQQTRTE